MGRDIYTRVIYGARASLTSTFGVVVLIFLVGSVVGVIAGYFGGAVDAVLMRIADMMLAFPGLVLALAVAGVMGASIRNAIIAIVAVNWTKYARLARSLVMKIRDRDYVSAAVVTGSKTPVHAAPLHAAQRPADADHHGGHGRGRHDAGDRGAVLPGLWCKAADTGVGLYAERGPCLYAVRTLDDAVSGSCDLLLSLLYLTCWEIPFGISWIREQSKEVGIC